MKILFARDAGPQHIQHVMQWLLSRGCTVHHRPHPDGDRICAVSEGISIALDEIAAQPGVASVSRIPHPFKLASRAFQPENTMIRIGGVEFGGEEMVLMAGPCAVEGEEQVRSVARAVYRAGARVLRGGAFKPRTSPYSFQGLGLAGLQILRSAADELGMAVVSEIMDISQLETMLPYVDILQVGARNVQNFTLLQALGQTDRPVLLKRGMSSTLDEWLMAAEYIMSGGNRQVIVCERGIRTFGGSYTRNTLDLSAVPVVKELSHLPVVIDPSHAVGVRNKVLPMARAAVAAGCDGLLVEVHPRPEEALCDGPQSLPPEDFAELAEQVRAIAATLG
ncbi:MAG: 3-deoxy-7-phosphoheptulonate synthase, partial [Candidatus Eisenbacteria bacterium]|nr:3-deoxy-7-phosphoheptulonate synthase [Candidatus Eisenbacteria bacterium]